MNCFCKITKALVITKFFGKVYPCQAKTTCYNSTWTHIAASYIFGSVVLKSILESSINNNSETVTGDEKDEKSKCQDIQGKGRFKVTSKNADVDKVHLFHHI